MATKAERHVVVMTVQMVLYFLAALSASSGLSLADLGSTTTPSKEASVGGGQDAQNTLASTKRESLQQPDERNMPETLSSRQTERKNGKGSDTQAARRRTGNVQTAPEDTKAQMTPEDTKAQETVVEGIHQPQISSYWSSSAESDTRAALGKRPPKDDKFHASKSAPRRQTNEARKMRGGLFKEGRHSSSLFSDRVRRYLGRRRRSSQPFHPLEWNTERAPTAAGESHLALHTSSLSFNADYVASPQPQIDEMAADETMSVPERILNCISLVEARHEGCRQCPPESQLWKEVVATCGHMMMLDRHALKENQSQTRSLSDSDFSRSFHSGDKTQTRPHFTPSSDYLGEAQSQPSDFKPSSSSGYLERTQTLPLSYADFSQAADYLDLSLPERHTLWTAMQSVSTTDAKNLGASRHSIHHTHAWPLAAGLEADERLLPLPQTLEAIEDVMRMTHTLFAVKDSDLLQRHRSQRLGNGWNYPRWALPGEGNRPEDSTLISDANSNSPQGDLTHSFREYDSRPVSPEETKIPISKTLLTSVSVLPFIAGGRGEDRLTIQLYPGTANLNSRLWDSSPFHYQHGFSFKSTVFANGETTEQSSATPADESDIISDRYLLRKSLVETDPEMARKIFAAGELCSEDSAGRTKKFIGKVIGGYKLGKRSNTTERILDTTAKMFCNFWKHYMDDKQNTEHGETTNDYFGSALEDYSREMRGDTTGEEHLMTKRLFWKFLKGFKLGKRDTGDPDKTERFVGKVLGNYKIGKREKHETQKNQIMERGVQDRAQNYLGKVLGGSELGKRTGTADDVDRATTRMFGDFLRGYTFGNRDWHDVDRRLIGKVLGGYKYGKRTGTADDEDLRTRRMSWGFLRGYKLGKRDGNKVDRRLIGNILGGYKLGKRTSTQKDEDQRTKRLLWDLLRGYKLGKRDLSDVDRRLIGGYKLGKREDIAATELGVRKRLFWKFPGGYKLGKRDAGGADRSKRFFGKIIGGYKIGRRSDNTSDEEDLKTKRQFGDFLRDYKFGARNRNDVGKNKRLIGKVLGGYKSGKREERAAERHGVRKRLFSKTFGGYNLGGRDLADTNNKKRFWGKIIGGYKIGKREDTSHKGHDQTKTLVHEFLGGYQPGSPDLEAAEKHRRFFGNVLGNYKTGKRRQTAEGQKILTDKIGQRGLEDTDIPKRWLGNVLGGYKMGKRPDETDAELEMPSYQVRQRGMAEKRNRFGGQHVGGYKMKSDQTDKSEKPSTRTSEKLGENVRGSYKTDRKRGLLVVSVPDDENDDVKEEPKVSEENHTQQFGYYTKHKTPPPQEKPVFVSGTVMGDSREHPGWNDDLRTDSEVQSQDNFKIGNGEPAFATTYDNANYLQNADLLKRSGSKRSKRTSASNPYGGDRTKRFEGPAFGEYAFGKRQVDGLKKKLPTAGQFNRYNRYEMARTKLQKRFWDKLFGGYKVGKRLA